ncbi:MAG TPA: hypothetical protein PKE45_15825 [Caldilineaceae bacterium]|nr:hypothetical protein [Caldilineaceae bacterium]
MPRLSVWLIRAALLYLLLGFSLGALLLWHKGIPLYPLLWRLLPAHIECLFFGWTVQLALGVAYWILPRFRSSRGNPTLAWSAFVLLNLGVWLVGLSPLFGIPALAGRLAETAAALAFAAHAWPRIKPTAV